jgi:peptide/nickel transport system substrate-binding protein
MAIDRQALIEAIWRGNARIAVSPILSSIWAHNPALEPWPYDPRQAGRILEGKGWRDGDGDGILERDGRPFSFELTTNTGNAARADTVVILQEHLKRVGIDARPRLLELNALVEKNNAHDFDATVSAFAIDTSLDVGYAYHSDAIAGGYNWGSYANPEVDRLIDEVRRQVRPEDAEPLLHRLQAILHQDQPHTFLVEPERLNGLRERLQDVRSNPLSSFLYLREWWLQPAP